MVVNIDKFQAIILNKRESDYANECISKLSCAICETFRFTIRRHTEF